MLEAAVRDQKPIESQFTQEQWRAIDRIIEKYAGKQGTLILALEEVQDLTGYLPEEIQRYISRGMKIPLSHIYGVVTFYSFFTMKPRGKHQIRICLGTACHVRGSQHVVHELENKLHIQPGECTADRQFSIETVRCLGACGVAPVMVIDDNLHKQVKREKVEEILGKYDNV